MAANPYLNDDCSKTLLLRRFFNPVQSECFQEAFESDSNMVVSAPTGSGKTGVMELCILRLLSKLIDSHGRLAINSGMFKTIYVGPSRALVQVCPDRCARVIRIYTTRLPLSATWVLYLVMLCMQERSADWQKRFGALGLVCRELTGDTEVAELADINSADIICTTPEKIGIFLSLLPEAEVKVSYLSCKSCCCPCESCYGSLFLGDPCHLGLVCTDAMTRKKKDQGGMAFFGDITLCLLDEVHFLGEAGRGSALEAGVVSRIRTVGQLPEMLQARPPLLYVNVD